jgi:nitric oxide dioxygenase
MTPDQIAAVKQSFALVAPIADKAGLMFYARLFELDPALRPMFPENIEEQAGKLMHVLAFAVANLDKADTLIPAVQALGARHGGYGVKPKHYGTVAAALLDTLATGLGPSFTPEVKDAWIAAYTTLSGAMIAAAANA